MKNNNNFRERILAQPSYWIEGINGMLYEAILSYKETNNMKQKDLATHLGISTGRVSQILNNGNINFSLDKIIQIALKVDMIPDFKFERKTDFIKKQNVSSGIKALPVYFNANEISTLDSLSEKKGKEISLYAYNKAEYEEAI